MSTTSSKDIALAPLIIHIRPWLWAVGIIVAICDLAVMPNVYFYALQFKARLTMQDVFAVITSLFGLFCFIHWSIRSFKLFLKSTSDKYRPRGWKNRFWALLEFFHVNMAICVSIFETFLLIGTIPRDPIIRLCALPPSVICFYFGSLFTITSICTAMRLRLPFNMSSTPRGALFRPALFAMIEDFACVDLQGCQLYRENMNLRWEQSPIFRRMIEALSWFWGLGMLAGGAAGTAAAFGIRDQTAAFGVAWVLPWLVVALLTIPTVVFARRELRHERAAWFDAGKAGVVHGSPESIKMGSIIGT